MLESVAPGQLPRSEKQVTNIWKREKMKGRCIGSGNGADDLFLIMQKAHTEDPSSQFIRAIRTAPDPAIVLSSDYQINDMVRFCTSTADISILTVDPTFHLVILTLPQ